MRKPEKLAQDRIMVHPCILGSDHMWPALILLCSDFCQKTLLNKDTAVILEMEGKDIVKFIF